MKTRQPRSCWRRFDGMTWPAPGERLDEIERTLRYGTKPLTRSERLVAASIVDAYAQLIAKPSRRRDELIREIRKGANV